MRRCTFILTFALVSAIPWSAIAETSVSTPAQSSPTKPATAPCQGDAKRATPPIPNHPTHIRNVVWKNMRAMCVPPTQSQTPPGTTSGKVQVK
jgi:hypothetical protein